MGVQGAQDAMAVVFHGRGLLPSARPLQLEPFYPPQKKFPGEVRGYQEPSGARQTGHDRKTLQGQTNRTGHPTGTRSPPGLAWKLRLPLGMTRSQGPLQGPSATASISTTGRQASLQGQDRQDLIKMFLWAQPDTNTALLAVTCGLDPRG